MEPPRTGVMKVKGERRETRHSLPRLQGYARHYDVSVLLTRHHPSPVFVLPNGDTLYEEESSCRLHRNEY